MKQPLRAIVLRYTSPVTIGALERVMAETPFEFCASVSCKRHMYSGISEENQPWLDSSKARYAVYEGVDHSALMPLDEELITRMRDCEATFMYMVTRHEYARTVSYLKRKQIYLRHVRFWNDFIENNNINVMIGSCLPHEIPDYIIYSLCKIKGIPTVYSHATPITDTAFMQDDIEESAIQIKKRLDELHTEKVEEVTLSEELEEYCQKQTRPEGKFTIVYSVGPRGPIAAFKKRILSAPGSFFHWIGTLFSVPVWLRRLRKISVEIALMRMRKFYDRHSVEPDFTKKYIYFPLQYQPECSTCPMAGAFVDQQLSVHLLSRTAPDDVLIYVKEHPRQRKQGIVGRNMDFYKEIAAMSNVRLMHHKANTFKLREHASGVATGTGTAGLEALFRSKPVFMFGHTFYQYAPCVFSIHTKQDAEAAMKKVFRDGVKPAPQEVRLFIKAIEDTRMHAAITERFLDHFTKLSVEHSTDVLTKALREKLHSL